MIQLSNFQKAFFALNAEKGISSTEGNNVANIVKELCLDITRRLGKIQPISEKVIMNEKVFVLDEYKPEPLEEIKELALEEGRLYALSAWVREAIKAKEVFMTRIKSCSGTEFLKEGESIPVSEESFIMPEMPRKPEALTDEDIIGEFTIGERSEYYELEAMAAHLGKKIHDRGMFTVLRQQIDAYKPTVFRNLGLGTNGSNSIVQCTLLYTREGAEKLYFELQTQHRLYEQKLNGYKARIKDELNIRNAKQEMDYKAAYTDAADKRNRLVLANRAKEEAMEDARAAIAAELEARRLEELNKAASLKIRIPYGLEKTFIYVQGFYK